MYPVGKKAIEQYMEHAEGRTLRSTSENQRQLRTFAHRHRAARRASRSMHSRRQLGLRVLSHQVRLKALPDHGVRKLSIVPRDKSQMLSQDSRALDNSVGQVHAQELEDPTVDPTNAYTVEGTSYATRINFVAPPVYGEVKPPSPAPGAGAAGGAAGGAAKARACEGPVRHGDSPLCVAKKALAQALQAERDVRAVGSKIRIEQRRADALEKWEAEQHGGLLERMGNDFDSISDKLDQQRRRLANAERLTDSGDQEDQFKAHLAQNQVLPHAQGGWQQVGPGKRG